MKNQWDTFKFIGDHGCSCAFMGAHRCSCLFDVFCSIHPFIEINIGFKRRSLSDCSTLDWIVFDFFFAIHLYKGWRTPSAWQTLGLKNTLRNHVNDGQQQSYKPKHVKVRIAFHL
jgi:hypothetical protein